MRSRELVASLVEIIADRQRARERAARDDGIVRTHVALVRGINVLGRNKVSMRELRAVVEALGHGDVITYIQSGNVVFTVAASSAVLATLADDIERAIAERLSVCPAVIVVSHDDLAQVVRNNPFPRETDHRCLHAVFLRYVPDSAGLASVGAAVERAQAKGSRDDASVVGRTLYLWTPDGFARSILRAELSRQGRHRTPVDAGTARNWATVTTLLSVLDGW
ncbi:MAG: DUF1697 domain-containing protein [Candidatus Dormibacteria bacterium]